MKNLWKFTKLSSFEKVDLKGFGRWLLAAIVLDIIGGRMWMQLNGEIFEISSCGLTIIICFGIYGYVYNMRTNLPQFTQELPYTSKQEVKVSIALLAQYFIVIAIIMVITSVGIGFLNGKLLNDQVNYGQLIRQGAFLLLYFLFMVALMFPLGFIREKKKWYIAFAGIAVVMSAISLIFINLLPSDGRFKSSGMVFEDPTMLPNYGMVIGIMFVVTVIALIASYNISQKMYEPKKYV